MLVKQRIHLGHINLIALSPQADICKQPQQQNTWHVITTSRGKTATVAMEMEGGEGGLSVNELKRFSHCSSWQPMTFPSWLHKQENKQVSTSSMNKLVKTSTDLIESLFCLVTQLITLSLYIMICYAEGFSPKCLYLPAAPNRAQCYGVSHNCNQGLGSGDGRVE